MRKATIHLQACDPVLAAIIKRVGPLRMPYREPTFAALARSITFQQLAGGAASTIWGRVVDAAAPHIPPAERLTKPDGFGHVTPASILALSESEMRACGLSRQKLSYLRDLAARSASGEIDFVQMPAWSDAEVMEHLTRVKGIGTWTAQMFLMFALRRRDILPTGDYGVRSALQRAYRMRTLPKPKRMEKIASAWSPWRSVACWYLWRSLDTKL